MRRLLGITALALVGALALPAAAHADTSDFTFDSFHADLELTRDADGTSRLAVTETLVAVFPDEDQNKGIIRAIPDDYDGVDLNTEVLSVTDETGADVPFEAEDDGNYLELALGDDSYVRGTQTYVIIYTQTDVVRLFSDTGTEELFRDINGTGWDQPFGEVSVDLTLTGEVAAAFTGDVACYDGGYGDTGDCTADVEQLGPREALELPEAATEPDPQPTVIPGGEQSTVISASAPDLDAEENLSLAVGFTPGTFETPEPTPSPLPKPVDGWMFALISALGALGLGALAAGIAGYVRSQRGGSRPSGVIVPQYSEPDAPDILQSAALIKRAASGVPAAVIRSAVRRVVRLVRTGTDDYALELADGRRDRLDDGLVRAVFGADPAPGTVVQLDPKDTTLMERLHNLSTAATTSLKTEGFREKTPSGEIGPITVIAQIVLLVGAVIAAIVSDHLFNQVPVVILLVAVGLGALLLVTGGFALRPERLTQKGQDATEYLLGMKQYLELAEEDRFRMLQSATGAESIDLGDDRAIVKLHERLLPWAVLWGVEESWARELELRAESLGEQPDWVAGGLQGIALHSVLRSVTTNTTAAGTASWNASSTGGFSGGSMGGGFSGGGGGGGGGGGR